MRHRFLLLCALFFTEVYSQHFQITNYTIDEGLPSANVFDVKQANDGRMWFATRAGLVSYDGFKWQQHPRIFSNFPHFIALSENRLLWSAADKTNWGLASYDGSEWQLYTMPHAFKHTSITGLEVIENSDDAGVFVALQNRGILKLAEGKWQSFRQKDGLPSDSVYCISAHEQKLYALTSSGMALLEENRFKKIPFENSGRKIEDFVFDAFGKLVLLGEGWFAVKEGSDFRITEVPVIQNLTRINRAYIDDKNRLYVPTSFTALQVDLQSGDNMTLNRSNGLIMDTARRFLQDREKNLWLISPVGISKIVSRRFFNYSRESGLLNDEVSAIAEYKPGHFVFGHNSGYTFFDGENFIQKPFPKEKNGQNSFVYRIWDLAVQKDGTIWSASIFRGISRIRYPDVQWYFTGNNPSYTKSVVVDSLDRPWALVNKNLYVFENNRFNLFFSIPKHLSSGRKIFAAPDNSIYVVTGSSGIVRVKPDKTYRHIRSNSNSLKNNVYAVFFDAGRILAGSGAGLFEVEADSFVKTDDFGDIDFPVYSIIKDKSGALWIGTDRGVLHHKSGHTRHYTYRDGLAGNEMNRSAALVDSKGRVLLGTDYGLSIYDSNYDRNDIPPPLVNISSIKSAGKVLSSSKDAIETKNNTILFEFDAVSFKNERAIIAQYMLEGLDTSWNTLDPLFLPEVRYNQLGPGDYRFKVRARSHDSDWSAVQQSRLLSITLPFYKQPWFALLITALAISMVFIVFLAQQRKKQAIVLEEQVRLRTEQLRSSEQKFREFFERSNDLVFFCSAGGTITDINTAGLNVLGVDNMEKVLHKKMDDFLGQDPSWYKTRDELLQKGAVSDQRLHLFEGSDKERMLLFSASLQYTAKGEVENWRGTIKDITDSQRMQEQEKYLTKMEAISQMAGGIAHDFNNLLGAILGYASLLKLKYKKGDSNYFALDTIEQSAERGARLTGQLLAFGRRKKSDKVDINVDALITKKLEHFKPVESQGIEISYKGNEELTVFADAEQLEQVLEHVLQNAVDAIKNKGRISIKSGVKKITNKKTAPNRDMENDSYGYISVNDDGCGMDQETRRKMFEPFFTTKKQSRGKGLGLAVVHGYLNGNKAYADVTTAPGKGTTFTIFLPLGSRVADLPDIQKTVQTKPKSGASVLVIEDEKEMRTLIADALESLDYAVQSAATGEEGLQLLEKKKDYDLIILDMLMPGMNGDEALKKMRQRGVKSRILIVSGFSTETHLERWKNMNVDGFLGKPFNVSELHRQVAALLEKV